MKNTFYCILIGLAFCACSNDKTQKEQTAITPTPTGISGLQSNNISNTNTAPVNNSNLIYNPAHGAPGHDCSIAVGALLNKNAQKPTAQPTTTTVTKPAVAENKVEEKSAKLNPAHGAPGHDCAVAVGAPLSSKAKTQKAITPAPQQVTTPAEMPKEAKNNVKINPAHGEAGHKCEVAVGAPLT